MTFSVYSMRPGAEVSGVPELYWSMKRNPLFDPYRIAPPPNPMPGDSMYTSTGFLIPDRYSFDLPDEDFFFPAT